MAQPYLVVAVEFSTGANGQAMLGAPGPVPSDRAWSWSPAWYTGEVGATADSARGDTVDTVDTDDLAAFLAFLG